MELEICGSIMEDAGEYSACVGRRGPATLAGAREDRERPQGPVASCSMWSVSHCRILCLSASSPTWVLQMSLLLWGSSFSRRCVQCCVSAVPSGGFWLPQPPSLRLFTCLYCGSFAVWGLCPGESCPESLMFSGGQLLRALLKALPARGSHKASEPCRGHGRSMAIPCCELSRVVHEGLEDWIRTLETEIRLCLGRRGQRVSCRSWLGSNGCRGVCEARRGLSWAGSLSGVRTACDHMAWRWLPI